MSDEAEGSAIEQSGQQVPVNAWDQLPGEPDELYAQFLFYVNLGPSRTVVKAFQLFNGEQPATRTDRGKGRKPGTLVHSGRWDGAAKDWNWRVRAARWDVHMLNALVPETASIIFQVLKTYAQKVLIATEQMVIDPTNIDSLRNDITTLTTLISPEAIARAAAHHSRDAGDEQATAQGNELSDE